MRPVLLLEKDDIVDGDDWCRPLSIVSMSGGHSDSYSFKCMYTGQPENNTKWVKVRYIFGACWNGMSVSKYNSNGRKFEFMRGDIPVAHREPMAQYNKTDHWA
jgi:hypothetical protein